MCSDKDIPKEFDKWQVKILGWEPDLIHLTKYYNTTPYRVFKDAKRDEYIFESDAFGGVTELDKITSIAERELRRLSGALKISRNSPVPVEIDYVFKCKPNGDRFIFKDLYDSFNVHEIAETLEVVRIDSQGNASAINAPLPRCLAIANLASHDPVVEQLMRYVSAEDHKSWVGMYRTYELIEVAEGGEKAFVKTNLVNTADLKRFKGSCNSYKVGGDSSRHTPLPGPGITNPMTLDEAYSWIAYFVQTWLAKKGV